MRGVANAGLMLGAVILAIAALWHLYWAVGGKVGLAHAIPERGGVPVLVPGRAATVFVSIAIAGLACLYASVAGLLPLPDLGEPVTTWMIGLAGVLFVLRGIGDFNHVGFFNRGGKAPFAIADRRYYSPVCLFLGLAGLNAAAVRLL